MDAVKPKMIVVETQAWRRYLFAQFVCFCRLVSLSFLPRFVCFRRLGAASIFTLLSRSDQYPQSSVLMSAGGLTDVIREMLEEGMDVGMIATNARPANRIYS